MIVRFDTTKRRLITISISKIITLYYYYGGFCFLLSYHNGSPTSHRLFPVEDIKNWPRYEVVVFFRARSFTSRKITVIHMPSRSSFIKKISDSSFSKKSIKLIGYYCTPAFLKISDHCIKSPPTLSIRAKCRAVEPSLDPIPGTKRPHEWPTSFLTVFYTECAHRLRSLPTGNRRFSLRLYS